VDIEPARVELEPTQVLLGRGPAERLIVQPGDSAVIDDLAEVIAPRGIDHLAGLDLGRVTGDDPVDQANRVRAADVVLVERRDVDQDRGVADADVLMEMQIVVCARREIAGPLAPTLRAIERRSAFVKWRSDGHDAEIVRRGRCAAWGADRVRSI
jgi:hypothetical protein